MIYYFNLPHEVDTLISRLKVKSTSDGYTTVVSQINLLEKTLWYSMLTQLKDIVVVLSLYQVEAVDGDLQDLIDELIDINWYNFLSKVNIIEKAVILIESL